jgi:SAM-dependent methyltransferase
MISNGFWIGHQMLGDVMGFCAAAHLLSDKLGTTVKVNFQEERKDAVNYFSGVEWVPKEEIPDAIDCGRDPTIDEWPNFNGVKRFYRFMDPSMSPKKSFDIHMNCEKIKSEEKIIGLITHANTQGDIPNHVIRDMIDSAMKKYPNHTIALFGNKDNPSIEGVVDFRQEKGDINWIINFMKKMDLLITPQSGPCFIAAGLKIPMWVYRSKEKHWDYVLNYDNYKVEKWWDRVSDTYEVFNKIYMSGGWNGAGSGPGSDPVVNIEYLHIINKILKFTPTIQSVLDIGCGDWRLMSHVDLEGKEYLGIDVSTFVINNNVSKYKRNNINFKIMNPVNDIIPYSDLIICKDVLQHLPNKDVSLILDKISKNCKYFLITNDYTDKNVKDIRIGEYRQLNVLLPPFNCSAVTICGYIGKQVILGQP